MVELESDQIPYEPYGVSGTEMHSARCHRGIASLVSRPKSSRPSMCRITTAPQSGCSGIWHAGPGLDPWTNMSPFGGSGLVSRSKFGTVLAKLYGFNFPSAQITHIHVRYIGNSILWHCEVEFTYQQYPN